MPRPPPPTPTIRKKLAIDFPLLCAKTSVEDDPVIGVEVRLFVSLGQDTAAEAAEGEEGESPSPDHAEAVRPLGPDPEGEGGAPLGLPRTRSGVGGSHRAEPAGVHVAGEDSLAVPADLELGQGLGRAGQPEGQGGPPDQPGDQGGDQQDPQPTEELLPPAWLNPEIDLFDQGRRPQSVPDARGSDQLEGHRVKTGLAERMADRPPEGGPVSLPVEPDGGGVCRGGARGGEELGQDEVVGVLLELPLGIGGGVVPLEDELYSQAIVQWVAAQRDGPERLQVGERVDEDTVRRGRAEPGPTPDRQLDRVGSGSLDGDRSVGVVDLPQLSFLEELEVELLTFWGNHLSGEGQGIAWILPDLSPPRSRVNVARSRMGLPSGWTSSGSRSYSLKGMGLRRTRILPPPLATR